MQDKFSDKVNKAFELAKASSVNLGGGPGQAGQGNHLADALQDCYDLLTAVAQEAFTTAPLDVAINLSMQTTFALGYSYAQLFGGHPALSPEELNKLFEGKK